MTRDPFFCISDDVTSVADTRPKDPPTQLGNVREDGEEEEEDESWKDLFMNFCRNSTIHGTYLLAASKPLWARCVWIGIVTGFIIISVVQIKDSMEVNHSWLGTLNTH